MLRIMNFYEIKNISIKVIHLLKFLAPYIYHNKLVSHWFGEKDLVLWVVYQCFTCESLVSSFLDNFGWTDL